MVICNIIFQITQIIRFDLYKRKKKLLVIRMKGYLIFFLLNKYLRLKYTAKNC